MGFLTCCPNYLRVDCYCYWIWLKPASAVGLFRQVNSYLHQNIFEAALNVWGTTLDVLGAAICSAAVLMADVTTSEGAQGASSSQKDIWETHIPSPAITFVIAQPPIVVSEPNAWYLTSRPSHFLLNLFVVWAQSWPTIKQSHSDFCDRKVLTFGSCCETIQLHSNICAWICHAYVLSSTFWNHYSAPEDNVSLRLFSSLNFEVHSSSSPHTYQLIGPDGGFNSPYLHLRRCKLKLLLLCGIVSLCPLITKQNISHWEHLTALFVSIINHQ